MMYSIYKNIYHPEQKCENKENLYLGDKKTFIQKIKQNIKRSGLPNLWNLLVENVLISRKSRKEKGNK